MPITLNFELSDQDLAQFKEVAERSLQAAGERDEAAIIEGATSVLKQAQEGPMPDFIRQRLVRLDDMVAMLRDEAWALSGEDRERVLGALAYFADPDDIIPDDVAVLGYLDDAVMIELAARDLGHEFEAYDDFCSYRAREARRRGVDAQAVGRADWLDRHRDDLVERMHERRERDGGFGYGSSSGYGSRGRGSYVRDWRPGSFRVG